MIDKIYFTTLKIEWHNNDVHDDNNFATSYEIISLDGDLVKMRQKRVYLKKDEVSMPGGNTIMENKR